MMGIGTPDGDRIVWIKYEVPEATWRPLTIRCGETLSCLERFVPKFAKEFGIGTTEDDVEYYERCANGHDIPVWSPAWNKQKQEDWNEQEQEDWNEQEEEDWN